MGYDLDDGRRKFVCYKPYRGGKLRIYRLLGSLYGMSQALTDFYKTLHTWLVRNMGPGFVSSESDETLWLHPERRFKSDRQPCG